MDRLTARDVAAGYPLPAATSRVVVPDPSPSRGDRTSPAPADRPAAPRALLHQLELLARTGRPVTVAFSGGRDSSLVLAAAAHVARREGTPPPVPLTQVWPHVPAVDESSWQELVVRELGLTDWQRIDMHDDAELLGPAARAGLAADGLAWPVSIHSKARLWRAAAGTHLLTGEGGDQVFGPPRVRTLHHWRRAARSPRRWARPLARALAPTPALRWRVLDAEPPATGWLQPAVAGQVREDWRRHEATQPWAAGRATPWMATDRAVAMGLAALDERAARHDVHQHHPLLAPAFVGALAADAGRLGWPDRTAAMTHVTAGLLPAAVLARTDKVDFTATVWGPATRAWLAGWDGRSGIDAALVDADGLRREWAQRSPHPGVAMLAQAAWLAQQRPRGALDLREVAVDGHESAAARA